MAPIKQLVCKKLRRKVESKKFRASRYEVKKICGAGKRGSNPAIHRFSMLCTFEGARDGWNPKSSLVRKKLQAKIFRVTNNTAKFQFNGEMQKYQTYDTVRASVSAVTQYDRIPSKHQMAAIQTLTTTKITPKKEAYENFRPQNQSKYFA